MKFTPAVAVLLLLQASTITPPKTWDESALHEWATPIAGLNVRPGHFSEAEYQRAPIDNLRTYPVYYPGREPAGYFDMIQKVGPKPIIEPETLKPLTTGCARGSVCFRNTTFPHSVSMTRRRSRKRGRSKPTQSRA